MRRLIFRGWAPFLPLTLALILAGCAAVEKNDREPSAPDETGPAAAAASQPEAKPAATSRRTKKSREKAAEEKSEDEKTPEKIETKPADKPAKPDKPADKPADQKPEKPDKKAEAEKVVDPAEAAEFEGLAKGEAEFILACRALGAGGKATMTGREELVFSTEDLGALGANATTGTGRHQAMVASVVAYAEKLRESGVELVLAPVPPKPVIYPDFLGGEPAVKDRRYDTYLQGLRAELEKAGVRVADVTKGLRSNRFAKGSASFPRSGLIWSPAAAAAAAKAAHGSVRSTAAVKSLARDKTLVARDSVLVQNGESFKARSVGWAQGDRLVPATVPPEGAPVLLIGDEHAAAYRVDGLNASLADQLSLAFGVPVESRTAPGRGWKEAVSAFTPVPNGPTRVVVWCFSATRFLDQPAAAAKKPSPRPRRRPQTSNPGSTDTDEFLPPPPSSPGAGLRLRDDPGLEARSE